MTCNAIPEDLLAAVAVDPESPSGLVWVSNGGPRRRAGAKVGHKMLRYWCTEWRGARYWIHRIVMAKTSGKDFLNLGVDHIDGNGFNNRVDNLRWADQSLNMTNTHRAEKQNGLPTGVHQRRNRGGYYFNLVDSGGKKSRTYPSLKEAVSAREQMLSAYESTMLSYDV